MMQFITIRDLRLKPGEVWDKLREQREIVLTSNGRPVAVIASVGANDVEETVTALRRARAQTAVSRMRQTSSARGKAKISAAEIETEIKQTRRARKTSK